jgi:mediator of RNA polymerase II transcription subunit 14
MSDVVRKRTLADWVVKTKKQVVKLYAVAKWSRDAETIQKCMVRVEVVFVAQNLTCYTEYHVILWCTPPSIRIFCRFSATA